MAHVWRMLWVGLGLVIIGVALLLGTELNLLAAMYIIGGKGLMWAGAIMLLRRPDGRP